MFRLSVDDQFHRHAAVLASAKQWDHLVAEASSHPVTFVLLLLDILMFRSGQVSIRLRNRQKYQYEPSNGNLALSLDIE